MNEKTRELRGKRAKNVKEMRDLLETAENEKRDLTEEENKRYSDMFEEQAKIKKQIEREERQIELEREALDGELRAGDLEKGTSKGKQVSREERELVGFRNWLCGRKAADDNFRAFMELQEKRALQADGDTDGGYLLAPPMFVKELIKSLDDEIFIRRFATKYQVTGASNGLGAVSLDNDPDDFDWTTELQTGSEDSTMSFGRRELKPHPLAKRIKISRKLISKTAADVIARQRLAYKLGITQEKAYISGTGAMQPLGLFTASDNGITTSQDVSTHNTTSEIKADNLKAVKYNLKAAYRRSAVWMFHRDGVEMISKLKDGNGRYLWQDAIREDDPDMILGRPVYESEYVPNTFSTGNYVGLFGDLSQYWIADDLNMEMQMLNELYAESNQMGLIGRYEGDGMPVLAEAFARVKLA
jgi:HK97 family phage major capsid protein